MPTVLVHACVMRPNLWGLTGVSFVDPVRCLRLGTYGLAVDGPFGHLWYKILDRTVEPKNPQVWLLKRCEAGHTLAE